MSRESKFEIVLMDFSGIYRQERFHEGIKNSSWVEVQGLPGSNCYCDEEAMDSIRKKIQKFSAQGIHFIDSGNYHYMSRIWLEKIQEPFRLLLFDNHTDMQPPAFGGILSCGGWAADSLSSLPYLKEIVLVGPSEEDFSQIAPSFQKRTRFLGGKAAGQENVLYDFLQQLPMDLPFYFSIDKDILDKADAATAWSQGEMKLDTLLEALKRMGKRMKTSGTPLLGVDICGEWDGDALDGKEKNDRANQCLLELFVSENLLCIEKDKDQI